MAGYTRNDTTNNIATGNIINASDLDGEFDAIQAAFSETTGHVHDGTTGNGAPITKVGPTQDVDVGATAVTPKTDNTVDLGSSTLEFKDLWIDGTANIDTLVADTVTISAGTITGITDLAIADGGTGASDAATARANLGAGTVSSVSGTGTVNGLTLTGTVTSTGSLTLGGTLSNVSLSSQVTGTLPIANGGTNATTADGALTSLGGTATGTSVFKAVDAAAARTAIGAGVGDVTLTGLQTLTSKTLTDPAIIGTILEDVFTITDGAAFEIDPGNGSVQLITLGASRTPKATNFAAGESVILMVDDGTAYTLTWTDATFGGSGVVWKTNAGVAPTLNTTGYTVITLWKVGTQVYGARVGDA